MGSGSLCFRMMVTFFFVHMASISTSHGTHIHESWYTYEWVMAIVWMSHSTRMNDCPGQWAQWVQFIKTWTPHCENLSLTKRDVKCHIEKDVTCSVSARGVKYRTATYSNALQQHLCHNILLQGVAVCCMGSVRGVKCHTATYCNALQQHLCNNILLQGVAVCCSVNDRGVKYRTATYCNALQQHLCNNILLQGVGVCCSVSDRGVKCHTATYSNALQQHLCHNIVLQGGAVCCSVSDRDAKYRTATYSSALQQHLCHNVVLQGVGVCCSVSDRDVKCHTEKNVPCQIIYRLFWRMYIGFFCVYIGLFGRCINGWGAALSGKRYERPTQKYIEAVLGNEYGLLLHIYTALLSIYWAVMHYTLTQEGCIYQWREDDDDVTDMGWLRLVGSSKFQVSFAEYSLFYRALVQKRPIILRSLLIVATPYVDMYPCILLD